MGDLLSILLHISLPIMILIAVGYAYQKIFKSDIATFVRIQMYVLVPAMVFNRVMHSEYTWELVRSVTAYTALLMIGLYIISRVYSAIARFPKSVRNANTNLMLLINTGNYGFPLIDLAFNGAPVATASQVLIVLYQNIVSSTIGVFQASAGKASRKQAFLSIIKMPVLYAIVLAAVFRLTSVTIPDIVQIPLGYLDNAFVGVALLALGVQLADVKLTRGLGRVFVTSAVKMISAPLLGFGIVLLLGIQGLLAQALIIGIATPTALFAAMIAHEFDNEPGYTAQVIVVTTVLCTVTLPAVIYFVRQFFPYA